MIPMVSFYEPIQDVMNCPECGRVFELGVATVIAFSGRTTDTSDDTLIYGITTLRAFPGLRHRDVFRVRVIKVCGHFTRY